MVFKTKLFSCETFIHLFVEHQSRPDKLMPFRVLKYNCNFISQHLNQSNSKRIPLIIPIVVYGKHPWSYSTDIKDLVDAPKELIQKYFLKPFILLDLNKIEDETLKGQARAASLLLTLKHIFKSTFEFYLPDILGTLKEVQHLSSGKRIIPIVISYIYDQSLIENKASYVERILEEFTPEIGDEIMTGFEQLRIEGRIEGRAEGIR